MVLGKSKVIHIWLRSFLILILTLLLITFSLTSWMVNEFSNEIITLNNNSTAFLADTIDARLEEIERICAQLELNSVNLALSQSETLENISKSNIYNLAHTLKNYKIANNFIADIYIYYPNFDFIVGDLGAFHTKSYYLIKNDLVATNFDSWLSQLQTMEYKNYFLKYEKNVPLLCFSKQLPYNIYKDKSTIITRLFHKLSTILQISIFG